jgi:hypothetical protein
MSLKTISSVVETIVLVGTTTAFDRVVPIDLTSIFRGYSLLPAVISIQAQTGDWDAIGQTRTVHLSDGSHAKEWLTDYQEPNYFAYVVSDFSGALGLLIASATGEWWFDRCDDSSERTLIRWSYTFIPKSWFAVPILWSVNKFLWFGYMRSVMSNVKFQLDPGVVK